jgi:hypothetical protein
MMNTEFIDFLLSLCIGYGNSSFFFFASSNYFFRILLLPNVSLQIEITQRTSRRHVIHQNTNQNVEEDQNEDSTENSPTAGHNERPNTTNEHGELELTTFVSHPSPCITQLLLYSAPPAPSFL